MCKCEIITTEKGRHHVVEKANQNQIIYAITPYGLSEQIKTPVKQIVKQKEYSKEHSIVKSNEKVHAKLILNKDYALTGSSNFTNNSIENEHEFIHLTHKDCHPEQYRKIKNFFETIWRRSKGEKQ